MRVLITGANGKLGRALAGALAGRYDLRTVDMDHPGRAHPLSRTGDLRDRDFAAEIAADCDAVIHMPLAVAGSSAPLDLLDMATRATYNLMTTASKATRFILISTLRHFERYPMHWRVTERWAPRPTTAVEELAPYLAELVVREAARVLPLKAIALRLGEVVDEGDLALAPDPRLLHVDDAVQAVELALAFAPAATAPQTGWWVFHIPGGGRATRFPLGQAGQLPFGYEPHHDLSTGAALPVSAVKPQVSRDLPVRRNSVRVVIYGAGGPLAAATSEALASDHVLRLTDIRPLAEICAENRAQAPGAPLPRLLDPPHETQVVDVADPGQVLEAARGMDAIVNCTAMRMHPVQAFRVNTLGAYNVMRAAVAHGIRRVVHTGPTQLFLAGPAGFQDDFDLSADVPRRPGTDLYFVSKYLGQEICRVFAEEYHVEVPCLLFGTFLDPAGMPYEPHGAYPLSVSWEDAGEAMRLALRAPSYPRPFEILHIGADLPHGKYLNEKAKRLLNWQPRDRLERHWLRELG